MAGRFLASANQKVRATKKPSLHRSSQVSSTEGEEVSILDRLENNGDVLGAFRAPEVCEVAGVTYRQLDYWSRTGLVKPGIKDASGSGTRRLYSFKDLVLIRAIKGLIEAGMSLQKIREAIDYVRGAMTEDPSELTLIATEGTILVFGPGEESRLIDALKGGQISLSIALGPLYNELKKSVAELERAKRRHPSREIRVGSVSDGQLSLF
ncbi:MAG: MerR family transcriptional regulator [Acidimicrobiia bacterium]